MSNSKEYNAEYYKKNRERIREHKRKYYKENKEKIDEKHKLWVEANREKWNKYKRERRKLKNEKAIHG